VGLNHLLHQKVLHLMKIHLPLQKQNH
jgi:hypothetical protein